VTSKLSEIDTVEVSLVDRGANRKRFALRKQEKKMKTKMTKAQKDSLSKLLARIKPGQTPERLAKALEELSEPARQAVLSSLGILAAARADLPEGMLQAVMEACGVESPDDLIDLISPAAPMGADNEPAVQADSPAPYPEEPMPTEPQKNETPVAKFDDATKAQIAKAEKAAAEANAELASLKKQAEVDSKARVELEKQVKAERDARLEKEFLSKAEKLSSLPTKAAEIGPVLKALHDANPELAAKVEKMLESANEKLKTVDSLLKERGHANVGGTETTAWGEIQKAAAELRKADPKLTEPAAIAKAMELNPKLYDAYEAEQKTARS